MKTTAWLAAAALGIACGTVAVGAATADVGAVRPVQNDCSGGYVEFTFDDGPDTNTPLVMNTLLSLNLKATFFVEGRKLNGNPTGQQMVRDLAANGFKVQNHTFDHASFTGASTGTAPLSEQQVTDELESASAEIVALGLPKPTLYRPPFGDINAYDDVIAQRLGYRVVMPWGTPTGGIIDSRDWTGITPDQIAGLVTQGRNANGYFYPPAGDGTIIAMHDGEAQTTLNTVAALQPIVDYMNAKRLCSTDVIRSDATGGVIPAAAPPVPSVGNLVANPSLEQLKPTNTSTSEPVCFQQGGATTASNTATWKQTSDARSGAVAENVTVTGWNGGDRKLVVSQKGVDAGCLASVVPGQTFQMWVSYKGSWAYQGTSVTKVSMAAYYRDSGGVWRYWTGGPLVPPSSAWNVAYLKTPALPTGATAVSYGLAIQGVGTLTSDDYVMTAS